MDDNLTPEQVEQAAIERYEQSVGEREVDTLKDFNPDGTPKQELILGKFKSQEDLLNAYTELEKKLGQPKTTTEETTKVEPETNDSSKVPEAAEGLLTKEYFDTLSQEYIDSGKLSEETYKTLEKKGISKDIVDEYIEGQKALATSKANQLLEYVGGLETYNSMIEWARENYSKEQADLFDSALKSGEEVRVKEQLDLLSFRIEKGTVNRVEGTSVSSTNNLATFTDKGDWQKAVRNPLYGKDAKYTRMVDDRYLKSLGKTL